jgi:hypothetical protein
MGVSVNTQREGTLDHFEVMADGSLEFGITFSDDEGLEDFTIHRGERQWLLYRQPDLECLVGLHCTVRFKDSGGMLIFDASRLVLDAGPPVAEAAE